MALWKELCEMCPECQWFGVCNARVRADCIARDMHQKLSVPAQSVPKTPNPDHLVDWGNQIYLRKRKSHYQRGKMIP